MGARTICPKLQVIGPVSSTHTPASALRFQMMKSVGKIDCHRLSVASCKWRIRSRGYTVLRYHHVEIAEGTSRTVLSTEHCGYILFCILVLAFILLPEYGLPALP